ncbi:MAG: Rid family detoxifying hydrolase [Candidatus Caldarchaeales archaeon]|jgi:2-iminobutanoate/2-iminopropanoate deaminase|nr:Rid family detoxifying hydrolase [Candidatus Caldarchaeales archaeon]MDT7915520.1 Rid family detoxifying hydrolase [Candidatus Caldarchaeales archaeon]
MPRTVVFTERAPRPVGPYSQAVKAGGWVFVAGQVAIDPATGKLVEGDIRAQARRTLMNVKEILEAAGASLRDVVKVNVYLARQEDFQAMNEVYREFFTENPPARTTVVVKMVSDAILIEVDAVAYVG